MLHQSGRSGLDAHIGDKTPSISFKKAMRLCSVAVLNLDKVGVGERLNVVSSLSSIPPGARQPAPIGTFDLTQTALFVQPIQLTPPFRPLFYLVISLP